MRVAVVDCGTNTIRLYVADVDARGGLHEVDRRVQIVRLGQGVDATGEFHPDALRRTFEAVDAYAGVLAELRPARLRFFATSAARDVSNREEFFAGIRSRLHVDPVVITGEQEARWSYLGALAGGPVAGEPVLVMDVGGGSTELILGDATGRLEVARSLDMGSVRLRERFLHSDPPTPDEIAAARAFVDGLLDASGVDLARARTWIGVAGTVTTLSAAFQDLPAYDRARVHDSRIPLADLVALADRLLAATVAETRRIPSMEPLRAEVICAGALICERIAARVGVGELVVRESDILDGAAADLAAGTGA